MASESREAVLLHDAATGAKRGRLRNGRVRLEVIGTPEARRLLEKLAAGAAAPETRAAQAALQRLKRRDASANGRTTP